MDNFLLHALVVGRILPAVRWRLFYEISPTFVLTVLVVAISEMALSLPTVRRAMRKNVRRTRFAHLGLYCHLIQPFFHWHAGPRGKS
jgi:hypothetical protein